MRRIKSHTIEKLEYVRKYIEAYLVATKRLSTKYYIDAFAGSGTCILCDINCNSTGGIKCQKCGRGKIVDGSALISLKTKNEFSRYIFIDIDEQCKKELEENKKGLSLALQNKIRIIKENSNDILNNFFKYISEYAGCLIFLDPEGPELEWETIIHLSKIVRVDLLILYPYDMSLVRLTTSDYGEKLDKFYGNPNWSNVYKDINNYDAPKRKKAMLDYYINNLKCLGFKYVVYKQIRRRLRIGKPLYHLLLVSHNQAAAKIMEDIFNKELDGQQSLIRFSSIS